eukprot:CAMPEP_0197456198 /NCGR_PEP_ID=MMETSP1175-20131217/42732_1 /TAXON_ID=1003142 /ORGANISM="Triceratium dubium, Strain CCMP147" /LENGTH=310 /DNA_ID=CAMNT_0042990231 /DNA_START=210 /DNA_END=1139 /DNA_ORIENTATION=+
MTSGGYRGGISLLAGRSAVRRRRLGRATIPSVSLQSTHAGSVYDLLYRSTPRGGPIPIRAGPGLAPLKIVRLRRIYAGCIVAAATNSFIAPPLAAVAVRFSPGGVFAGTAAAAAAAPPRPRSAAATATGEPKIVRIGCRDLALASADHPNFLRLHHLPLETPAIRLVRQTVREADRVGRDADPALQHLRAAVQPAQAVQALEGAHHVDHGLGSGHSLVRREASVDRRDAHVQLHEQIVEGGGLGKVPDARVGEVAREHAPRGYLQYDQVIVLTDDAEGFVGTASVDLAVGSVTDSLHPIPLHPQQHPILV